VTHLRAFGRFWWDFVVGDDWRAAAGLAVALLGTWALTRHGLDVWWVLPLAVAAVLAASVWRAARS
jgi:hypothetical protein